MKKNEKSLNIGNLVLLKNNQFIILNKPAGISVQPDKSKDLSFIELVSKYTKSKLFLVHRIDRPISGIIIFAKTKRSLVYFNEQFKNSEIEKTYIATVKKEDIKSENLVVNFIKKSSRINKAIIVNKDTPDAKKAVLNYKIIKTIDNYHLLEIKLKTGRFHQIRAQLANMGVPIKGDVKYGARRGNKDRSIYLHAYKVKFLHPVSNTVIEEIAPLPDDTIWNLIKSDGYV